MFLGAGHGGLMGASRELVEGLDFALGLSFSGTVLCWPDFFVGTILMNGLGQGSCCEHFRADEGIRLATSCVGWGRAVCPGCHESAFVFFPSRRSDDVLVWSICALDVKLGESDTVGLLLVGTPATNVVVLGETSGNTERKER